MSVRVIIKGFLSHAKSRFEFPLGLSTHIRGQNGSGKSDIYRAIRWALYASKSDNVHPIGTSNCVEVKLYIGDNIFIKRTAVPNTIYLRHGTKTKDKAEIKKYTGLDAVTMIEQLFGTKKHWQLCSHISSHIHPFISASGPQRVEMLNDLIGSDENIKKILATLTYESKSTVKTLDASYTKKLIEYDVIYKDVKLDESLILTTQEAKYIEKDLASEREKHKTLQVMLAKKFTVESRIAIEEKMLFEKSDFIADGLAELRIERLKTSEYFPAKARVDKVQLTIKEKIDRVFTTNDLDQAIIDENKFRQNDSKCKAANVSFDKSSIDSTIEQVELSLSYADNLEKAKDYNTLSNKITKFGSSNNCDPTQNYIQNKVIVLKDNLVTAEHNIGFSSLLRKHLEIKKIIKDIEDIKSIVGNPEEYISKNEVLLSNQWILDARISYQKLYASLEQGNLPKDINKIVNSRLVSTISSLKDIERSKTALACPHCMKLIVYSKDGIAKFDGVLADDNSDKLKRDLDILTKLSSMKYPDAPDWLTKVNVKQVKANIAHANKALLLDEHLSKLKLNLCDLPGDVIEVDEQKTRNNIKVLKSSIAQHEECLRMIIKLSTMTLPIIPKSVTQISKTKAEETLSILKSIELCNPPEYSPSMIRNMIELNNAHKALSKLTRPSKSITEKDVVAYASNLTLKENSIKVLSSLNSKLAELDVTKNTVKESLSKISSLKKKLYISTLQTTLKEETEVLNAMCDELDAKKQEYEDIVEFKDIVENDCRKCIATTLRGIQTTANSFLESVGTDIRMVLVHDEKIKIVCLRDGNVYGKPDRLSSGEGSLVSFALTIAFSLQSRNSILILDEATDKLSIDNKDKCVELLLEIMKENNKTVLLTDHHCHSGDYDKVIDL